MAETNGRRSSEASSSSDFYSATPGDLLDQHQPATNGAASHQQPAQPQAPPVPEDDEDKEEDDDDASMEMSDVDEDAPEPSALPRPSHAGAKRKLSDASLNNALATNGAHDSAKKTKVAAIPVAFDAAGLLIVRKLPPDVWQQVFLQFSPAMLSRCLRVCKTFKHYLTSSKASSVAGTKLAAPTRLLDSQSIWAHSRKTTYSTMPRPLRDFSELQMLQLVGGTTCQSCGKPHNGTPATNVFNAGPGEDGVRVIWPFRLRLCGGCFTDESQTVSAFKIDARELRELFSVLTINQDIDLLKTKHRASALIRGLPHAFRTPDGHFVPDHVRQSLNGVPSYLRLSKTFHKKDVDGIVAEIDEVNSFGDGASDEWQKGLTQKGKDVMADSSRWERWEGAMPLGKMLPEALREYDLASFPRLAQQPRPQRQPAFQHAHVNGGFPPPPLQGAHPLPQPVHVFPGTQPHLLPQMHHPIPHPVQPVPHAQRPVRTAQEVEAARQARRTDIERRCLDLTPPLHPGALQHMKAYRDTMQLATPLTDLQWENILKPKFMDEREAAELQEHRRAQQLAVLQAALPSDTLGDTYQRPAKEVYDQEYDKSQEPLRLKLGEYAADHINGPWLQGRSLNQDSAPLFAADVLLHVYKRYVADKDSGILASILESAPKWKAPKEVNPLLEPFLSLDNVKWVFDNKVRTYTDPLCRDLFLCEGCVQDGMLKWFAFEGLIQHYGAKHTTEFSKGNVVVHWQTAEWPEHPPFYPKPEKYYVAPERKYPSAKGQGRNKTTSHARNDDAHHRTSSAATHLDKEQRQAMFSKGYNALNAAAGQKDAHPGLDASWPWEDRSQQAKVEKVAATARDTWDKLSGVHDLIYDLECVRVQTMIYHMVMGFWMEFTHPPGLDLLTDALATDGLMHPIQSTHNLLCKMCTADQANRSPEPGQTPKAKRFNLNSLITHFQIHHLDMNETLEWENDLIELPEPNVVGELIHKPGMNDEKLALIAEAFPKAFKKPLPRLLQAGGKVYPVYDSGIPQKVTDTATKSKQKGNGKKKKKRHATNGGTGSADSGSGANDDEYDPRRPMPVDQYPKGKLTKEFDPSRFDTDLARKDEPAKEQEAPNNFNLAPGTLAALERLQGFTADRPTEPERSPSVGRSEPHTGNGHAALPAAAPPAMPQITPDIAAILASLTGQAQGAPAPATPTSTNGHSQAPRNPFDPYTQTAQQASPAYTRPESNRPASRYVSGGSCQSSAEPAPAPAAVHHVGQDLQAAFSRNAQHYVQNGHATYAEPSPAYAAPAPTYTAPAQTYATLAPAPATYAEHAHTYAAPAHTYATSAPAPAPRSPPRYRIVYEDEPAYHRQPSHGQPAPVQYIKSEPGMPSHGTYIKPEPGMPYHYEQQHYEQQQHFAPPPPPQPQPIYVDEYGRRVELVPVEAAPAPVQYVPHPYEQQYHHQQYHPYAPQPEVAPQPVYYGAPPQDAQRQMRYGPPPPQGGRYVYEDEGRGSVPRA